WEGLLDPVQGASAPERRGRVPERRLRPRTAGEGSRAAPPPPNGGGGFQSGASAPERRGRVPERRLRPRTAGDVQSGDAAFARRGRFWPPSPAVRVRESAGGWRGRVPLHP